MKKNLLIWIGIFLLFGSLIYFLNNKDTLEKSEVCIEERCFSVEVVDTPTERERGLMYRESLEEHEGMLFIFENSGNYPFWMKNTLIPLDIIWISQDMEIVYIQSNALPCETDPCPIIDPLSNAKYVLEINGGSASKSKIEVGKKIKLNLVEING